MRKFTRWDQSFTTEETNEITVNLALWCLAQVGSDIKQPIIDALKSGNFGMLNSFELDYNNLTCDDARFLRQCLALFSKRVDIDLGIDRDLEGYLKFKAAEELCRQTNHIFKSWSSGNFFFPRGVDSVLYRASQKISKILGDVPNLADLVPRFGPGATTQVKKQEASARRKLSQTFACSEEFIGVSREALGELQGWLPEGEGDTASVSVLIHEGKLNFVPKNARISRAICVEPMLNTMFQLGIDKELRQRLKQHGLDLTQQDRNKNLARIGSLTGELATLDLSSASDTVSRELVYHLLPLDWVLFLEKFRTGTVSYRGESIRLQKFSSMGNGFTFPLESLIFYALALSCVEREKQHLVSVYGDDIIIPTESVEQLTQVLTCCGFLLNKDKSFSTGPFRESCGGDYYKGIDIRPVYLDDRLTGYDAFRLHNYFVRQMQPEPASFLLDCISDSLKLWGPDGFGDGHLITDAPPLRPHGREDGWCGYLFDTFVFKERRDFHVLPGDYILPRYTVYVSGPQEGLPGLPGEIYLRFPWLCRHKPHYDSVGPSVKYLRDRRKKRDNKDGSENRNFGVVIPGTKGYKRISIYTLNH